MKKILLNNLSLKLLAVVIACVIWFAVMYNINPMDTKTITVPVSIINGDTLTAQNWVYDVVGELEVEVEVEARSFDLSRITASNFNLYVDMLYPTGGTTTQKRYQISKEVVANADLIESYTLKTDYLDFELEEIVSREFAVNIITSGDVAENYTTADEPTSVPETVTVTGRSSEVEKINSVVYYLDIKDASEEINETGAPKLLDYDGNELTDLESVTMSPETVQVCQAINQTKSVVVTCNSVSGEPATGYGLSDIVLDVTSVKVSGYKAVLADVVSINIPAEMIDVEGLTEDTTFAIELADLELPEGVSLVNSNSIVNVTVKIEKKKQNNFRLQLPDDVSIEGQDENYEYTFSDTVVIITASGISSDLDNMDSTNIVATLDVSGYEEGTYEIDLSVTLPDGISLVEIPTVTVTISEAESETETETETETTTTAEPVTTTVPETSTTVENTTTSTTTEEEATTTTTEEDTSEAEVAATEDSTEEETAEQTSEDETEDTSTLGEAEADEDEQTAE